jgi:hypothetical protein
MNPKIEIDIFNLSSNIFIYLRPPCIFLYLDYDITLFRKIQEEIRIIFLKFLLTLICIYRGF